MNMVKHKLLLIFCGLSLLIVSCSKPETIETLRGNGTIYGTVVDGNTGEPLQGATVTLYPGGHSVVTGSNGQYEFINLLNDGYLLQISKSGYYSDAETVTVYNDGNVKADVSLSSGNSCLNVMIGELYFNSTTTSKVFVVSNIGDKVIDWNLYTDFNRILSFDKEKGTLNPGENIAVSVTMNHAMTNDDLTSFPIYIYSGKEELGVIATINKESAGMNNSLLVGNWALVNKVFWSEPNNEYEYNSLDVGLIVTFRPDYYYETNERRIGTGTDGEDAENILSYNHSISDYTYDPANSILILNSEMEFDKTIFRINKLSEKSLELETIELKDSKEYNKMTFVRKS